MSTKIKTTAKESAHATTSSDPSSEEKKVLVVLSYRPRARSAAGQALVSQPSIQSVLSGEPVAPAGSGNARR